MEAKGEEEDEEEDEEEQVHLKHGNQPYYGTVMGSFFLASSVYTYVRLRFCFSFCKVVLMSSSSVLCSLSKYTAITMLNIQQNSL